MLFDWLLNWLRKQPPLYVPPLAIEVGTSIDGKIFPNRTSGFVKFDYKIFADIPWKEIKSTWNRKQIIWNNGEVENFRGEKKEIKSYVGRSRKRIHSYWKKIGYFPCYYRSAYIDVPEDDPVCKSPEKEMWPRPIRKKHPKDSFAIVVTGKIAIYEICRPVISKSNVYEHEFFISPVQGSETHRFYPDYDLVVPFAGCK